MNERAVTAFEIAATEAIAAAFQQGLKQRDMGEMLRENRYAIAAHTGIKGLTVVVRDNRSKDVIAGVDVGHVTTLDAGKVSTFQAMGDQLAARVESMIVKETLAGGEAMVRGQRVLTEYVKGSVAGTAFAAEALKELQSEDFGVGNEAVHVYASDSAIFRLGTAGLNAVSEIPGERLSDAVKRATRRVRARFDVDDNGRLTQVLKVT